MLFQLSLRKMELIDMMILQIDSENDLLRRKISEIEASFSQSH
jgi:hypothetical protein